MGSFEDHGLRRWKQPIHALIHFIHPLVRLDFAWIVLERYISHDVFVFVANHIMSVSRAQGRSRNSERIEASSTST